MKGWKLFVLLGCNIFNAMTIVAAPVNINDLIKVTPDNNANKNIYFFHKSSIACVHDEKTIRGLVEWLFLYLYS